VKYIIKLVVKSICPISINWKIHFVPFKYNIDYRKLVSVVMDVRFKYNGLRHISGES